MRFDERGLSEQGQHKSLRYLRFVSVGGAIFLLLFCAYPSTACADDALDQKIYVDIAPNTSLDDALIAAGTAARVSVMIDTATVVNKLADGIRGTYRARDVFSQLLRKSGLTYSLDGRIVRVTTTSPMTRSHGLASPQAPFTRDFQAGTPMLLPSATMSYLSAESL